MVNRSVYSKLDGNTALDIVGAQMWGKDSKENLLVVFHMYLLVYKLDREERAPEVLAE